MALSQYLHQAIQNQLEHVVQINSAAITETAKQLAFYTALLNSASSDLLYSSNEQTDMLKFLKKEQTDLIETYQNLVNQHT